jgi:tripartite-type tricarboxylate transporter receptor subunit TctC
MLAPGRTPRPLVNSLNAETGRVLDLPETRDRIASQGAAALRSTPEAFDKLVRDEIVTRTKVWRAAGVKAE